jgi:multiple sugar transport system permease protein
LPDNYARLTGNLFITGGFMKNIPQRNKQTFKQILCTEKVAGYVCTLPFILGFTFFIIVPMGMSLCYSFSNYNILSPPKFVGLDNYFKMFTDETFYKAFFVTIKYAFISVPLKLLFALIVAILLLKSTKATPVYRAVYYLPSIIGSSVAVAILWKRMFGIDGLINKLFNINVMWLGSTSTALWVIILLSIWQFGSSMLIFLSSMKQIPISLYEAARVDGANKVKCFFKITLPLLTSTIFFNLVMQLIGGLLVFAQGQIITGGKPLNSTLFYVLYMYQQSFEYGKVGYGAAMGWVLLAFVAILTGILFKTKKFWVYEGGY